MLPDRVSNPGPLTYESGALPIALRGPASTGQIYVKNLADLVKVAAFPLLNPIALRKAKIVCNFGLSECNRVKETFKNQLLSRFNK